MQSCSEFIVFSGIDGSGKSTQAKLLVAELQRRGLTVAYVWARWEPQLFRPLSRLARRSAGLPEKGGMSSESEDNAYSKLRRIKRLVFSLSWVQSLWLRLAAAEYLHQVRGHFASHRGKVIVTDRYLPDFVADIAVNFECNEYELCQLLKSPHLQNFPTPQHSFFINIPPEVGYQRKEDGTPLSYLQERTHIYSTIARVTGMTTLDGTLTVEVLSKQVAGHIGDMA